AKRLLGMDASEDIIGQSIMAIVPNSRLLEVLSDGQSHVDQPMIMGNTLTIVNRVPVLLGGTVIGAVASFRDKVQLDHIDQRLADVGRYVDALRSQRHEFMNKLHTISGLIQLQEYDLVRELINQVNDEQQQVLEFFLTRVRDSAVVGLLIGKMHRAKELGIRLSVDPQSHLLDPCPHREIVVTILGNALENAFEALGGVEETGDVPAIEVFLSDRDEQLQIRVSDNGPGIDPLVGERIFEDGISTKGPGRGFGLALLSRLVSNVEGELAMRSSGKGASLEVTLPIESNVEKRQDVRMEGGVQA
ncbi:MAG: sensor histidine kinase, partial [Tumebacillaceae bacterium]